MGPLTASAPVRCWASSNASSHSGTGSQSSSVMAVQSASSMDASNAMLRASEMFWRAEIL